jgi:hypothetical protein
MIRFSEANLDVFCMTEGVMTYRITRIDIIEVNSRTSILSAGVASQ